MQAFAPGKAVNDIELPLKVILASSNDETTRPVQGESCIRSLSVERGGQNRGIRWNNSTTERISIKSSKTSSPSPVGADIVCQSAGKNPSQPRSKTIVFKMRFRNRTKGPRSRCTNRGRMTVAPTRCHVPTERVIQPERCCVQLRWICIAAGKLGYAITEICTVWQGKSIEKGAHGAGNLLA